MKLKEQQKLRRLLVKCEAIANDERALAGDRANARIKVAELHIKLKRAGVVKFKLSEHERRLLVRQGKIFAKDEDELRSIILSGKKSL